MRNVSTLGFVVLGSVLLASPALAEKHRCCDGQCEEGRCKACDGDGDGKCECSCCHPPEADQGCTPGYWKQDQHFDAWSGGLDPNDLFVDVFGVDAFPDLTLLDVLEQGGGGIVALGRHAVAGLLNSLSVDVAYAYTDDRVLDGFANAYDSGEYEAAKDKLEDANEAGCPLN